MKKTYRHRSREIAVESLYALDFNHNIPPQGEYDMFPCLDGDEDEATLTYAEYLISGTLEKLEEIDNIIRNYSLHDFNKICLLDKALLRVALFSLLFSDDKRSILIIDEFIKIDRDFDSGSSYKYINGILDRVLKDKENDNTEK